ncbi:MAG: type II secretion system F family protein [Fimbriimonadaceae bacterium]|nr:type II secretion system F family protein [Fimbriimonadaceae bacterium]
MARFEFKATDSSGKHQTGFLEASDIPQAIAKLGSRGYQVISLNGQSAGSISPSHSQVGDPALGGVILPPQPNATQAQSPNVSPSGGAPWETGRRFSAVISQPPASQSQKIGTLQARPKKDFSALRRRLARWPFTDANISFLFSQIGSFAKAGVNPASLFNTLADRARRQDEAEAYREIAGLVAEGRSLGEAMEEFPEIFSPSTSGAIKAAEVGGYLPQACDLICQSAKTSRNLRFLANIGYLYLIPALTAIPVVVSITRGVESSIEKSWNDPSGGPAAGLQYLLSGFAKEMTGPMGWILLTTWVAYLSFVLFNRHWKRRAFRHRFAAVFPVLAMRTKAECLSHFMSHLSYLQEAGVAPRQSVALAAAAVPNEEMARRLTNYAGTMKEQTKISEMLGNPGLFSPEYQQLAFTGEQTGQMGNMMRQASEIGVSKIKFINVGFLALLYCLCVALLGGSILAAAATFYSGYYGTLLRVTQEPE